jgi:4-hydroxy-2-oxoglutarate aldolase
MTSKALGGVIAPVVTTFDDATDALAPEPFRANLRAHLEAGLAGVLLAGSTGEAVLLDEAERDRLVEWARPEIPANRWLLVGIGGESTRGTVERARRAAERGADAVLVVAPHYYGEAMTAEALGAHFRRVADACPVPVLLYNMPRYTHLTLHLELVRSLSTHDNIVGMKDSSGDPALFESYLGLQRDGFTVLTGHGGALFPALRLGAPGGILAVSLFAPALSLEVYEQFRRGDLADAEAAQVRLRALNAGVVGALGIAGIKAAMDAVGLAGGPPRPPLLPLPQAERQRVAAMLDAAGAAHVA